MSPEKRDRAAAAGTAADITPDSRVGDVLERWPALEEVLLELSPRYRALKNPVLRRTVAKVATLRQVAQVGGVPLSILIDRLRSAVGVSSAGAVAAEDAAAPSQRPSWAEPAAVAKTHDAREAIEAGEHPLAQVMADLSALSAAQVYELVTPFVPAPLVDIASQKGFEAVSVPDGDGVVRTYFRRRTP